MTSTSVDMAEGPDMATAELLATDRCDRCGAQAYVRTKHEHGDLLWCAHHYKEFEQQLAPSTALDERQRLT